MAEIVIPDEGLAGIRLLLALGSDGIDSFRFALEATGPTLVTTRERAVLINEALGATHKIEEIEQIFANAVMPLHTLRLQLETTPAGMHAVVARNAERSAEQRWAAEDRQRWADFRPQLVELFGSKIITVEAKAAALLRSRPNTIHNVRLFSDVRPVFDDAREEISASLVINTLRVRYFDGTDARTIQFSLDPSDLDELEKQIMRARQKNDRLREQNLRLDIKSLEFIPADGGELSGDGDQQ